MEPTEVRRGGEVYYEFGRYRGGRDLFSRLQEEMIRKGYTIGRGDDGLGRVLRDNDTDRIIATFGGTFVSGYWFIIEEPENQLSLFSKSDGWSSLKGICDSFH